jgi:hypothetical protein
MRLLYVLVLSKRLLMRSAHHQQLTSSPVAPSSWPERVRLSGHLAAGSRGSGKKNEGRGRGRGRLIAFDASDTYMLTFFF